MRRRLWSSLHRWLGIGLGLWFALVGLTGAILVYEDAIDAWLNPRLLRARSPGPTLPIASIVTRAEASETLGRVERVRPPATADGVYRLQMRAEPAQRVGSGRIEALFDPGSGTLLGTRDLESVGLAPPQLLRTLYELHRNVLLGPWGSNLVGIAGFLLLASAISGGVIAWPRRAADFARLIWINRRANPTRIVFDVHRSTGAVVVSLLLLSAVTGLTLVYLNYVRDLVGLFSRVETFPTIPWRAGAATEPVAFGDIVAAVERAYPDHRIAELHVPPRGISGYLFYLRRAGDIHRLGDTVAWVHPLTAEVLVERSPRTRSRGETFMHWLFPLHSGAAFGSAGLLLMCLTGLMPLLFVSTGLWVWLRKRRGQRIGRRKRLARAQRSA